MLKPCLLESLLCWSRERINTVNKKLGRLEKEIVLGKPGAQDVFNEYREELVIETSRRLLVRTVIFVRLV